MSRLYDADRETVWAAWTDADGAGHMVGAGRLHHHDPSGRYPARRAWAFTLTTPDGKAFENRHKYEVLERPERIVYRQGDRPEDDNAVSSPSPSPAMAARRSSPCGSNSPRPPGAKSSFPMGAIRYPGQSLEHLADYLARNKRTSDHA